MADNGHGILVKALHEAISSNEGRWQNNMAAHILWSRTLTLKGPVGTAVEVRTDLLLVLPQILQVQVFSNSPGIDNELLEEQRTPVQGLKDTTPCVKMEAVEHVRGEPPAIAICRATIQHHVEMITAATQRVEENIVERQIERVGWVDL